MKEQVFEKGDVILNSNMSNDQIIIIWDGKVQVRVERFNKETNEVESHWLCNLRSGASISIFKCFDNSKSLVSYIAASSPCVIFYISTVKLEELAREFVVL